MNRSVARGANLKRLSESYQFDPITFRSTTESRITPNDIFFLIKTNLSHGNRPHKILMKLKGVEQIRFKKICDKMDLLNANSDYNFMRNLSLSFPTTTLEVLLRHPDIGSTSLEKLAKVAGVGDYPTIARHLACAEIIPKDFNARVEALYVIMLPDLLFHEDIQTIGWRNSKPEERFIGSCVFLKQAFNLEVFSNARRWELAREYGIITQRGDLSLTWISAATAAANYVKSNYNCVLEVSEACEVVARRLS